MFKTWEYLTFLSTTGVKVRHHVSQSVTESTAVFYCLRSWLLSAFYDVAAVMTHVTPLA